MKEYTDKAVLDLIKNRKDINFFADVVTPLHVLGIEAAMWHLGKKGIVLKGYIAIMAHDVTGYALTESHFHIIEDIDVNIINMKREYGNRSFIQKIRHRIDSYRFYGNCKKNKNVNKPIFYYITPYTPSFDMIMDISRIRPEYDLRIIITDEGLANYTRSPYKVTKTTSLEWGLFRSIKYMWDLSVESRWFRHRLAKAGMISDFLLLYNKAGRWEKNEACIEAYRMVLSTNMDNRDFSYYENVALISPSPLYEAKILKERIDINIYKDISRTLDTKGIKLVAKPHPREKQIEWYEEINCILEKEGGAALESILAHLDTKPRCIIGDSSTTLVTANIIFGIKAISINKLIDRKYLRDTHYFDNFNNAFSSFVHIPETMEELKQLI